MHYKEVRKGRNPGEGETCNALRETGKNKETSIPLALCRCLSLRYNEGEGQTKKVSFFLPSFLFFFLRDFFPCSGDGGRRMCGAGAGAEVGFLFLFLACCSACVYLSLSLSLSPYIYIYIRYALSQLLGVSPPKQVLKRMSVTSMRRKHVVKICVFPSRDQYISVKSLKVSFLLSSYIWHIVKRIWADSCCFYLTHLVQKFNMAQ